MQDKVDFAQRLKAAMEAKGWAPEPAVLERKFNERHWGRPVTLHGVRKWLLGDAMPRPANMATLAALFDMPVHVLRDGPTAPSPVVSEPRGRWDEDIGWSERELFLAFMRLPVPMRRVVRDVIKALSAASKVGSNP